MKRFIYSLVLVIISLFFIQGCETAGGGYHARIEARREESARITNVSGGETFQVSIPFDKTYDCVLNYLKKQGQTINSASKDIGQIITAISITGGWRQTGTRIQVTLIKDSETETTVRVVVSEQIRYKALSVDPWGQPAINNEKTAQVKEEIQAFLRIQIQK